MIKQLLLPITAVLLFCCTNLIGQSVFVNEIHYDNASSDIDEAIEIAAPAGTDLSGWFLELYNGSNGTPYRTRNLSGIVPDQQNGFGTLIEVFPANGIQNGAPDGIALVDALGTVVQFLSYEGSFTAVGGSADGLTSTDIGIAESSSTPVGASLTLVGEGFAYPDFSWSVAPRNSYGNVNADQFFGEAVLAPKINEFVLNHTGSDTNEFIEIVAAANTDLSTFSVLAIEGDANAPGTIDGVITLGTTDENGYFTTAFLNNAFENGTLSLLVVSNFTGSIGDDLDANDDGILDSLPWDSITDDIGVNDGGAADYNYSAVTLDQGFDGVSFTVGGASRIPDALDTDAISDWVRNDFDGQGLPDFPDAKADNGEALNSPASENKLAVVVGPVSVVINELDADTAGTDTLEFLELYDGGAGNTDLDGLVVVLYNGNNDLSYSTIDLNGLATDADGYFVIGNAAVLNVDLVVGSNTFQNGADAVALYVGTSADFPNGSPISLDGLVDAVVYGTDDADDAELLQLLNEGQEQLNEAVNEEKDSESLQRIPNGQGGTRNTLSYVVRTPTPGAANDALVMPGQVIAIAEARASTEGDIVTVTGILTAADNFAGPAFIQDTTAAIAIFDSTVHGEGLFAIGDSITVTGTKSTFNGLAQLSPVAIVKGNTPPNTTIAPKTITLSQLGDFPGELVRIVDVIFPNPGDLLFGNANFLLTDASGTGELRIDNDVADLVGLAQPQGCTEIVGVVGRFNDTFQLLPRKAADLPCALPFVPPGDTLGISKTDTFDVVTWNIEWFGDENNAPPAGNPMSDAIQRDSVLTILRQLDADVYTVQEIADDTLFAEMVAQLQGYDFILSDAVSNPNGTPPFQKVGFIYKTTTVNPVTTRALLQSIHPLYNGGDDSALEEYPSTTDRFYASGRLPFLMTADVTINGVTEQLDLIALHARANSGSDARNRYDMRKFDVEVLKDSLDTRFADRNVILLGDYNDDVDETVADISVTTSSFERYVNDPENYTIITSLLSDQGFRSFVSRENMIDHIAYTSELSDKYLTGSVTVHYEVFDNDYSRTASDHFPVSARFNFGSEPLEAALETIPVSCNGAMDGKVTAMVSGGVAPYSYMWSDGQITASATGLEAGSYALIIEDARGDVLLLDDIMVTEPKALEFKASEDTTVYLGYGDKRCAVLSIDAVNNGLAPYTVTWSTGETGTAITVCPEEDTVYTVSVSDVNGCTVMKEIGVAVLDISCGKNPYFSKIQLCYRGKTLCVPEWTAEFFMARGATLGGCGESDVLVFTEVKLARNPVGNLAQVHIESTDAVTTDFIVYDFFGRERFRSSQEVAAGTSVVSLDIRNLRRGLYFLKPTVNGSVQKTVRLYKK